MMSIYSINRLNITNMAKKILKDLRCIVDGNVLLKSMPSI